MLGLVIARYSNLPTSLHKPLDQVVVLHEIYSVLDFVPLELC